MLWHCEGCHALYAPGLAACPQCGGTSYRLAPGGEPQGDVLSSAPATAAAVPAAKKPRTAATSTPDAAAAAAPAPDTAVPPTAAG